MQQMLTNATFLHFRLLTQMMTTCWHCLFHFIFQVV